MKIILEGCEGTGKTTLAKKLIEKYNLDYVHITNKDPNDYDFYKQTLRKEDVVYDRHFIGEMIYPKIYNRKGNLDKKQFQELLEFAKKENVHIIVLTTYFNEIVERIEKRNKYKPDFIKKQLVDIYDGFEQIALENHLHLIDTSFESFEDICEELENEYSLS